MWISNIYSNTGVATRVVGCGGAFAACSPAGGIFSPECLGVQGLAERLGLVYLPLNGCASQDFTSKS